MSTVLIIDDAATDRQLAGRVVSEAGAQPVFAENGEQGISLAAQHRPAVILLDVVMPVMDGFQTCRKLKGNPATQGIPVVLVTSKGGDSDKFWGKRQGADDHLVKPYTPTQLRGILTRYL